MTSIQNDRRDAKRASSHSLTLERALRLLRILAEQPDGLSVSELAHAMATHRAGTYRLLGPLTEQRLVTRGEDGRYWLGAGLIELASRVESRLQDVAVPELQKLANELRATTALTVRDGEEAVVAAVIEPSNSDMHIAYRTGLRHRLDQAASGIAILAAQPPRPHEREAVKDARRRGWASSSGELLPGAAGVGIAVAAPGQRGSASISAVWIDERDQEEMAAKVAATAERIVAALRGAERP